ncbi:arsenate reductase ArsC [bacterium]|nr:arsenate reductase ArsC [bacterium]
MSKKNKKTSVVFVCTHNSARSQIAESLLRSKAGGCFEVYSAGTNPVEVHPYAIKVMDEIGISLETHNAKSLTEFINKKFDVVVTVCDSANEACPIVNGTLLIHKGFIDPSSHVGSNEEKIQCFREVRDAISDWLDSEFTSLCNLSHISES